ncbi:unnamed protein product [Lymnaea stagnalis]|uniref:Ig-like domain-containing protein n=1 Tax=Lymnaea stagnalis TaxID=6523 RepID=A0AAV2H7U7_LYMST
MAESNTVMKFNTTTEHVTVVEGGRVILPCSVDTTAEMSVIWVNPKKIVMSVGDRRLIDDHRISVERPYIKIWNLLIRNVRYNDSGIFECRINTNPVQTKKVHLDVKVPPAILSQLSSDKVTLEEGQTATLVCNVTGIPQPNVTWYKRNYKELTGGVKEKIGLEGEVLIIHNVSRSCDDIYECYVDNGVPPAVSKAIRVVVDYAPEVIIPNPRRMGQYLGKETILECNIFAHPQALTSWTKGGKVLNKSDKYDIEVYKNEMENSVTLALKIRDLTESDFGRYECTGSNFLGEDKEDMILYELVTTTVATTKSTPASNQLPLNSHSGNHFNTIPEPDPFSQQSGNGDNYNIGYPHHNNDHDDDSHSRPGPKDPARSSLKDKLNTRTGTSIDADNSHSDALSLVISPAKVMLYLSYLTLNRLLDLSFH